jgi:hypothetical protein
MLRRTLTAVLIISLLLVTGSNTFAAARCTSLTFDELPFQPVNRVSINGVTFGFQINGVPSTDAFYGAFGPGSITYIQDPSLEGNTAGTLTLEFAKPVKTIEFGLALSTFETLTPAAQVTLYNPGGKKIRDVIALNTTSLVSFTEGQFRYSGKPVRRVVITFNSAAAFRFAFDNLTFCSGGSANTHHSTGAQAASMRSSTAVWSTARP